VDLDGFAVVASSPTRGVGIASSRRLATSPTAGPRSHRTADPEVCAREVSTRVGQVSGLTVTNVQLLATHASSPATRLLSAFLEVVRAPSSLSFTEGQPAPDRVPKCTSVAVYELNATTQALRNHTRRTRIHVERYWPARCLGAVFALRTRMKDVPPRQLAFVRLPSAFLACRCFNLLVLRSHRPRKC
jgi:hypothetical protein